MMVQIQEDIFVNHDKVDIVQVFKSVGGSKVLEIIVANKSLIVGEDYMDNFLRLVTKDSGTVSKFVNQFTSV